MGGGGRNSGGKNHNWKSYQGPDGKFGSRGTHGRDGKPGRKSNPDVRELPGGDKGAKEFFKHVTIGYVSERPIEKEGYEGSRIRVMPDGGEITYRPATASTSGSPAVDINRSSTFPDQTIHFPKNFPGIIK